MLDRRGSRDSVWQDTRWRICQRVDAQGDACLRGWHSPSGAFPGSGLFAAFERGSAHQLLVCWEHDFRHSHTDRLWHARRLTASCAGARRRVAVRVMVSRRALFARECCISTILKADKTLTFTDHHKSTGVLDTSARDFVLWYLSALGLPARSCAEGVYIIEVASQRSDIPDPAAHPLAAMAGRQFTFDLAVSEDTISSEFTRSPAVEYVTWQSPLMCWLLEQLQGGARLFHAVAARQPLSVHELTEHLFAQYRIDNGTMHLAGCSLEDRPFLRLSYVNNHAPNGTPQLVHCIGTSEGELIDPRLLHDLELNDLVPLTGRAPRIEGDVLQRWAEVTRRQFEVALSDQEMSSVAATLVWCKYAEGKLSFSIGSQSAEVAFAGWGRLFVDRRQLPPPYRCPLSGRLSYHLGATDDGRITVADAIATCSESSRRVLESELLPCAVSGRRALPEYLQVCPVSGENILASVSEPCATCQQRVSPKVLVNARCPACRHLVAVAKVDPGMARILDAHPRLDRLRSWKMAETAAVHVLVGSSAWKRLLVVIDKQTLEVLHIAAGSRLSHTWVDLTDVQRAEWIGSPG